jgi:hypothetical protein
MSTPTTPPPARIRFGDGPAQELPLNLAEQVLREVWAANPLKFGEHVKKAMVKLWVPSDNGRG